jgi:hypothetical protein
MSSVKSITAQAAARLKIQGAGGVALSQRRAFVEGKSFRFHKRVPGKGIRTRMLG